jgi:uncharacterized protein YukE
VTFVTVNPLVAASVDGPKDAWSGVWIAEDIELIIQGVKNGSWVDGTLGVVGAGLDALALISDPVGVLLQYGVSWIIEHVKPLTEALDWLAGDPAQISAQAQTWRNVASDLRTDVDNLLRAVQWDVSEWTGAAADAYRAWAKQQQQALEGLAKGAEAMAAITEGAGFLIAAVRILVRDAIATLVSRLIVYAAEELASFGLATPLVVEQVTTLIASWAGKIARWLKSLLSSLRALAKESKVLEGLIEALKKILAKLRGKGEEPGPAAGGKKPSKYDSVSDKDLVADRGANVGRPGRGRAVREVQSEEDLKEYFDALTRNGATDIAKPDFPGRIVRLEDGTIVTWRTKSRTTGSIPTVDVNPGKGQDFKVHIDPNGW